MEDRQRDLFRKIRWGVFGFTGRSWEDISQHAKNLICSLLVVDPGNCLSAKKVLEHDWFCDTDEQKLRKTSLSNSQTQLKLFMEKTTAPDQMEEVPWVTQVTPIV